MRLGYDVGRIMLSDFGCCWCCATKYIEKHPRSAIWSATFSKISQKRYM